MATKSRETGSQSRGKPVLTAAGKRERRLGRVLDTFVADVVGSITPRQEQAAGRHEIDLLAERVIGVEAEVGVGGDEFADASPVGAGEVLDGGPGSAS